MPENTDPLSDAIGRHVPLLELLDIRPVKADGGKSVFEMVVDEKHLRTLGILHGGVTATLLDTALGFAAVTVAPDDHYVVTVQLNINFIRPAWESERLLATGEIRHSGQRTAVAHGDIRTADGTLMASGTATFLFLPNPPSGVLVQQED